MTSFIAEVALTKVYTLFILRVLALEASLSSKIQKWGNSLGIRIPKAVIKKANLEENSEVEILHKNGNIVIMPIAKKYKLADLLSEITKENLHSENDSLVEGNEVW